MNIFSELIRNQTLKFLSKTLPILKVDDTLPKVTQVVANDLDLIDNNSINKRNYDENQQQDYREDYQNFEPFQGAPGQRQKRHARSTDYSHDEIEAKRKARKFCDGGGVFCALYRAVQGEPISSQLMAERREESVQLPAPRYEGPPTPCPASPSSWWWFHHNSKVSFLSYQGLPYYMINLLHMLKLCWTKLFQIIFVPLAFFIVKLISYIFIGFVADMCKNQSHCQIILYYLSVFS